ncbi:MAG: MFS transporter, partial [Promethearchaeota archaeon]
MSKANEKDVNEKASEESSFSVNKSLWRNIYVLSVTMGMMILFFGWNNFLNLYIRDLGASTFEIGIFLAVTTSAHALSCILFARISDRRGRKPFVIVGTFLTGVAYTSFILFNSWVLLMIPVFIQQLLHAAYVNPMQVMMAESVPSDRRGTANGVFQTIGGGFNILAPLLAAFLIIYFAGPVPEHLRYLISLPYLFVISGAVMMTVTAIRWLMLRETYEPVSVSANTPEESITGNPKARGNLDDSYQPEQALGFRSKSILGLYGFIILASLILASINAFMAIYLDEELGFTVVELGIWISFSIGVNTIAQIPTGRIVDKYSKRNLLLLAVPFYLLGIILFIRASDLVDVLLSQIPFSVGNALRFNTEFAMIAAFSPRDKRSTGFALQYAIFDISFIFGPLIGGFLYGISPFLPFAFVLILSAPTLLFGVLFLRNP